MLDHTDSINFYNLNPTIYETEMRNMEWRFQQRQELFQKSLMKVMEVMLVFRKNIFERKYLCEVNGSENRLFMFCRKFYEWHHHCRVVFMKNCLVQKNENSFCKVINKRDIPQSLVSNLIGLKQYFKSYELQIHPISLPALLNDHSEFIDKIQEIIMSIWVGVRVRPFNHREKSLNSARCVDMKGNLVRLGLPGIPEKGHEFEFDQCFWSHDGFKTNDLGYFEPINEDFADQQKIYDAIGTKMLNLSFKGLNTSFLAYGQTATGKTYSTFGLPENVGLVETFGKALLKQIQQNQTENIKYSVQMSMFQIYLEQVEDLFVPIKQKKQSVQIKQNKQKGLHLQNLTVKPIFGIQDLVMNIQEGCKNKNVAATMMSRLSSRGHTFVYFYLTKRQLIEGNQIQKMTLVQFVDLAGSERICKTGTTASILKEVKQVNKSILAFKNIISALSSQSSPEKQKQFVPYRDSKLTRLLQESLEGKTNTFVLCPISPAYDSYQQSLSTLRMASTIKKLKKVPKSTSKMKKQAIQKQEKEFEEFKTEKIEQE